MRIQRLASPHVEVTGFVEDLTKYYEMCRIFVVPLRFGAGINYKLTEAMSYGIGAVGSRIMAQGLDVQNGREVLIAENDDDFVDKVVDLMRMRSCGLRCKKHLKTISGKIAPQNQ